MQQLGRQQRLTILVQLRLLRFKQVKILQLHLTQVHQQLLRLVLIEIQQRRITLVLQLLQRFKQQKLHILRLIQRLM